MMKSWKKIANDDFDISENLHLRKQYVLAMNKSILHAHVISKHILTTAKSYNKDIFGPVWTTSAGNSVYVEMIIQALQ